MPEKRERDPRAAPEEKSAKRQRIAMPEDAMAKKRIALHEDAMAKKRKRDPQEVVVPEERSAKCQRIATPEDAMAKKRIAMPEDALAVSDVMSTILSFFTFTSLWRFRLVSRSWHQHCWDTRNVRHINLPLVPPGFLFKAQGFVNLETLVVGSMCMRTMNPFVTLLACRSFKSLLILDLGRCRGITHSNLYTLSEVSRNLEVLRMPHCQDLDNRGFYLLSKLGGLTELALSAQTSVNETQAGYLAALTKLKVLDLRRCAILPASGLAFLTSFEYLEMLDLQHCMNLTDKGVAPVKNCTNLEHLDLAACDGLTEKGLTALGQLGNLRWLSMGGHSMDDSDRAAACLLRNLLKLVVLDLCTWENLTDATMTLVGRLRLLEELHLNGCEDITCAGVVALCDLERLWCVNLSNCRSIGDVGLKSLAENNKRLEDLFLSAARHVTDEGLGALAACRRLKALTLDSCRLVSDDALLTLARGTRMEDILLAWAEFSSAAIKKAREIWSETLDTCDLGENDRESRDYSPVHGVIHVNPAFAV